METKKNKVAVLTEKFVLWTGGLDFIKNIILSLDCVAQENNLEIYIFVENKKKYRQYKGLKRLIQKIKEAHCVFKQIKYKNDIFEELEGFKFVSYTNLNLAKTLKELKIDFIFPHMHPDYFNIPVKQLGYLYDCQHKYYADLFDKHELKIRNNLFKKMTKHEKKIMVNSNSVKDDLIKHYAAKAENIIVLPCVYKLERKYFEDNSNLIKKYNLPQKYFIISNQFWIHKDHSTAFKAFAKLLLAHPDIELVCTGLMKEPRKEKYIDSLIQLVDDLGCKDKIRFLGLIPKIEQIEIMKNSIGVIQPTLFEGGPGGGCVQEAIALGVPAILSDIPVNIAIKDYDNIFYFKAQDENDLYLKMKNLLCTNIIRINNDVLIEKSLLNHKILGQFLADIIKKELG